MRTVFTVTVGRSGSEFLAGAINQYASNAVAEHEPPALLLARLGQHRFFRERGLLQPNDRLTNLGRGVQRRFFFTDAMMGRGEAYRWLEDGRTDRLRETAAWKARRIARFARRGAEVYVEVSQYFIKTQAEVLYERFPGMQLVKLTRDPLRAAKSLANRPKDLFVGGPPPDWRQNVFRIPDWETRLSRFQVFLHRWLETELRFHRFVATHRIAAVHEVATERLEDPVELARLFGRLGIRHRPIGAIRKTNTNRSGRNPDTVVGTKEVAEYEALLALLPAELAGQVAYLRGYEPRPDVPSEAPARARA